MADLDVVGPRLAELMHELGSRARPEVVVGGQGGCLIRIAQSQERVAAGRQVGGPNRVPAGRRDSQPDPIPIIGGAEVARLP